MRRTAALSAAFVAGLAATALPGTAQVPHDQRTVADVMELCVSGDTWGTDPIAVLTDRIWLTPTFDDYAAITDRHMMLRSVVEYLGIAPETTPSAALPRLEPAGSPNFTPWIVLHNSMIGSLAAVLDIGWERSKGQVARTCTLSALDAPAYEALFLRIAKAARASDDAFYQETPFVVEAGDFLISEEPKVRAWAWRLDAAAYEADTGEAPAATHFFEFRTLAPVPPRPAEQKVTE